MVLFIFGHAGASACCMQAFSGCGVQPSDCSGFACCGAQAQELWCMGLVALQHVESSQIRDWTHVPSIGRWILYHWTTREVHWDFKLISQISHFLMPQFFTVWLFKSIPFTNAFQWGDKTVRSEVFQLSAWIWESSIWESRKQHKISQNKEKYAFGLSNIELILVFKYSNNRVHGVAKSQTWLRN